MSARIERLSKSAKVSAEFSALPNDGYVTSGDLEALGIAAISTLATWRSRGLGPAYILLGGGVRYRVADVRGWLAAGGTRGPLHHREAAA
jgi:hypothetical protein